ncbi:MAG: CRISPR-associated endonuclease Cas2 [Desulfatiglandales bacterium]
MFCLVCFDIVDDRKRTRTVKILKEYGVRVQKSVFECSGLTEERFLKMKDRLDGTIDSTEDTVRYYTLCRGCLNKVEFSGIGPKPQAEKYKVV